MKHVFDNLRKWPFLLSRIEQIGISSDQLSPANIQIRMINMLTLSAFLISLFYIIINIINKNTHYLVFHILYLSTILLVFYMNHLKYHKLAKLYLMASSILILTFIHFVYGGADYHLLCLFIVTMLLIRKGWVQLLCSIFLIIAIVLPRYGTFFQMDRVEDQQNGLWLKVVITILFIFILVRYFLSVQHRYQAEIKEQKVQQEMINKHQEQLFAIIAHDIRAPLIASSQSVALILKEENIPARADHLIRELHMQLTSLRNNTENLLQWSKQNFEEQSCTPFAFELKLLINEIIDSMKIQIEQKKICIHIFIDSTLQVFADREHLRIIIKNLMSNAIKFSYIDQNVHIIAHKKYNRTQIRIEDFGKGISSNLTSELFDKVQSPAFGTLGERGTGLGLTLVKGLIELNKGNISVSSKENEGSIFTLDFPTFA